MSSLKKAFKSVDWILLIFLILILNQSVISIKAVAIAFIYIVRPNFRFGFLKGRLPKFYPLIILLAIVNLLLFVQDFSKEYLVAFGVGIGFWVLSILTYHQVKLSLERNGVQKVHNALKVFVIVNFVLCIWQIFKMYQVHDMYPYNVNLSFPLGLSAGDNVFGIFLEYSYYNVMVSTMLIIYFLFKRDILFYLLSASSLLLVFANTGTLITLVALTLICIVSIVTLLIRKETPSTFGKWLKQISIGRSAWHIGIIIAFIISMSYVVSSENVEYALFSIDAKKNQEVAIQKTVEQNLIKADTAGVSAVQKIDTLPIDRDTVIPRYLDQRFAVTVDHLHNFKGKMLSFQETYDYLTSSTSAFLFGAGPVRFSSVTAQRMAGYDDSRIFKKILPRYKSKEFTENHFLILKARTEDQDKYRSALNWLDSFYNQILGEYGLLGLLLFLIFYVGYFLKRIKYVTYGFWLSVIMVPFALFSYMFEHLGPIVIFELLMEMNVKENIEKSEAEIG